MLDYHVAYLMSRVTWLYHMMTNIYPKTAAAFEAMGALDQLERIHRLDVHWQAIRAGRASPALQLSYRLVDQLPELEPNAHYDLIYAGGGLGLLHAAVMAKHYGLRVLVFDQAQVGCAHREWNISREELTALVATGFCSWDDLHDVIMAEYKSGVVRFYSGAQHSTDTRSTQDAQLKAQNMFAAQELWLPNVLNLALDAGALLSLARHVLEENGGHVRDHCRLHSVEVSPNDAAQVMIILEHIPSDQQSAPAPHSPSASQLHRVQERLQARLLIDGMGSGSPLTALRFGGQAYAGVCPTVGTVVSGLEPGDAPWQHNPIIGDILLTVADAQRGQQYMWEGFPGRGDELTVYLFYYDTLMQKKRSKLIWPASLRGKKISAQAIEHPGLLDLFEDYFSLLPSYKQPGPAFRHLKPVYGYIPSRHSMRRQEAPLLHGILPIGDAAAQQSPLTFCGFGSHIRNLERTTSLLDAALRDNLTQPENLAHISPYQANVALNWIMSRFMQPWRDEHSVNRLQNIFLAVLNQLGEDLATRFFRDQMRWSDYHRMILGMFRAYPRIVLDAWQVLGAYGIQRWIADYLRYSREAMLASVGRRLGQHGREALLIASNKRSPALGLAVKARIEEWQVMGWLY